jgi:hypothetical protein
MEREPFKTRPDRLAVAQLPKESAEMFIQKLREEEKKGWGAIVDVYAHPEDERRNVAVFERARDSY